MTWWLRFFWFSESRNGHSFERGRIDNPRQGGVWLVVLGLYHGTGQSRGRLQRGLVVLNLVLFAVVVVLVVVGGGGGWYKGLKNVLQDGGFGGSQTTENDMAGLLIQHGQGQGNASRRWFGRMVNGRHEARRFLK